MYIPDPSELMDMQIEDEMDKIDSDGKYPCCYCGQRLDPQEMYPINNSPASPLSCGCDSEAKYMEAV